MSSFWLHDLCIALGGLAVCENLWREGYVFQIFSNFPHVFFSKTSKRKRIIWASLEEGKPAPLIGMYNRLSVCDNKRMGFHLVVRLPSLRSSTS